MSNAINDSAALCAPRRWAPPHLHPARLLAALCLLTTTLFGPSCSATLGSFGGDLGRETSPLGSVRIPYADLVGYFGYAQPGAPPDEVRGTQKAFYVYLWLPRAVPELGARMISPVPSSIKPTPRDIVDTAFRQKSMEDAASFFDPWIRIERCPTAASPEDTAKPCGQWVVLGDNDDAEELPALPTGVHGNALLRITSVNDDPLKSVGRGLYRIAFGTTKSGDIKGTYLLQIGVPIELRGLTMARSLAELQKVLSSGVTKQ